MVDTEENLKKWYLTCVGVLLQGPRAEILLSNPAALELLGLTEDQLLGKTSFDPEWKVIHEDGSPFWRYAPCSFAIAPQSCTRVIMGFIVLFLKITFGC
jgi:PAS domain-containing protein